MSSLKKLLVFNYSSLAISLTELEDILRIVILVITGIISIIVSIKEYKKSKNE
ncbi:MAG: hypothetical protein KDC67_04190 [Ignavibacteriae bacterium]|nr:hypothetical protein [Ignavibacteriota bacterium]